MENILSHYPTLSKYLFDWSNCTFSFTFFRVCKINAFLNGNRMHTNSRMFWYTVMVMTIDHHVNLSLILLLFENIQNRSD